MNSIDAMARDMKRQLVDLPAMPLPEHSQGRIILAGSGDSYAVGLAMHYLSSGHALCCSPLDIITNPAMVDGAVVYFISISGRTKASMLAAGSARRVGATTVAVTASSTSPLVAVCESSVALKFENTRTTSGTIGFTAAMLACARIVANATCPTDLKLIYRAAERKAAAVASGVKIESVVVLGNSILYPAAIYGALKCTEVFGSRAIAYLLEEFCHAPIFGHREDQLIILGTKYDVMIARRLQRAGLETLYVDCGRYSGLDLMLYATFFMQHLTLAIAKRKKKKECYFLQDKKLLGASSDIIY